MAKKSFIIHIDALAIVKEMPVEIAGAFIQAIYDYQATGKLPEMDFALKMAIAPFINQFIRDDENYSKTVERNAINGKNGGRPKKPDETNSNPKNPVGYFKPTQTHINPLEAKKADSDNDNESGNDNGKIKEATNSSFPFPAATVTHAAPTFISTFKNPYEGPEFDAAIARWHQHLADKGKVHTKGSKEAEMARLHTLVGEDTAKAIRLINFCLSKSWINLLITSDFDAAPPKPVNDKPPSVQTPEQITAARQARRISAQQNQSK